MPFRIARKHRKTRAALPKHATISGINSSTKILARLFIKYKKCRIISQSVDFFSQKWEKNWDTALLKKAELPDLALVKKIIGGSPIMARKFQKD